MFSAGRYVSNVWCKESKKWFLCNDESDEKVEISVKEKSTTGYMYFYLHEWELSCSVKEGYH